MTVAALTLLAALGTVPQQDGTLTIDNFRRTHGILGPTRASSDVTAGDVLTLTWQMKGLKMDARGKVKYSLTVEINDSTGRTLVGQKPEVKEQFLTLGQGVVSSAYYSTSVGPDTAPGDYKIKITIKDLLGKGEKTVEHAFKVVKPDLALVRLSLTHNVPEPNRVFPAPPVAVAGQRLYVNFFVLGFARDRDGNPHFKVSMTVLDNGKSTVEKPVEGVYKKADKDTKLFPFTLALNLNRAGTFTVVLKVEDLLGNKKEVSQRFNVTVHPSK